MDEFKAVIAKNVIDKMDKLDKETIYPMLGDDAAEIGLMLLKKANELGGEDYDEVCNTLFDRFAKR